MKKFVFDAKDWVKWRPLIHCRDTWREDPKGKKKKWIPQFTGRNVTDSRIVSWVDYWHLKPLCVAIPLLTTGGHIALLCQGWAIPVLEGCGPACFRCFPATTHLNQMTGSPSGLDNSVNDPFIWIRVAKAGEQLRHPGYQPSRTGFTHPWAMLTKGPLTRWFGMSCNYSLSH